MKKNKRLQSLTGKGAGYEKSVKEKAPQGARWGYK